MIRFTEFDTEARRYVFNDPDDTLPSFSELIQIIGKLEDKLYKEDNHGRRKS